MCSFSNQLDKLNLIISKNGSNEFYNYATAIDILQSWVSLYHFASFGLKMTL